MYMNSVSIREFQMNAGKYLAELPVLLTRFGTPVAKISAVEWQINDVDAVLTPKNDEEGFFPCEGPFCKLAATTIATYENPTNFETEAKVLCDRHLKELKKSCEVTKEESL